MKLINKNTETELRGKVYEKIMIHKEKFVNKISKNIKINLKKFNKYYKIIKKNSIVIYCKFFLEEIYENTKKVTTLCSKELELNSKINSVERFFLL